MFSAGLYSSDQTMPKSQHASKGTKIIKPIMSLLLYWCPTHLKVFANKPLGAFDDRTVYRCAYEPFYYDDKKYTNCIPFLEYDNIYPRKDKCADVRCFKEPDRIVGPYQQPSPPCPTPCPKCWIYTYIKPIFYDSQMYYELVKIICMKKNKHNTIIMSKWLFGVDM